MSQLLTLSRAARLVGVTRGALQKKVKDGELPTFEGMVAPDELLRVYPHAHFEDNTHLERLMQIKDSAFAKAHPGTHPAGPGGTGAAPVGAWA